MVKKLKSQKGFTAVEAVVALVIITVSISLMATIIYNIYIQILNTHRNSMATMYAVDILEKVAILDYDDEQLEGGTVTSNNRLYYRCSAIRWV